MSLSRSYNTSGVLLERHGDLDLLLRGLSKVGMEPDDCWLQYVRESWFFLLEERNRVLIRNNSIVKHIDLFLFRRSSADGFGRIKGLKCLRLHGFAADYILELSSRSKAEQEP